MRLRHPDGSTVHLAYCTNVHPAQDVAGLVDQIERYCGAVRERLGVERLGIGLWLPAGAAHALADDADDLAAVRSALRRAGCEVVTLNAFPYGHFHAPVVKRDVYSPDWTEAARLDYTLACAEVLAALMPDDVARGSISTLPLAWRTPWDDGRRAAARAQLRALDEALGELRRRTGRTVRVALEAEPGCVVETSAQSAAELSGLGEHVGACVDLCHLATEFEDPAEAAATLAGAGVAVVKTQVSAALHAERPAEEATRASLAAFAEDRFLHQTRARLDGRVERRDDLPEALAGDLPDDGPWRVHFHVPLHAGPEADGLRSTTDVLEAGLRTLVGGPTPLVDHLEVETYTWSVLPEGVRPRTDDDLVAGIAAELSWTAARLETMGVTAS